MKRRDFIKKMGGAAVATSVVLSACKSNNNNEISPSDIIDGQGEMTYRTNPTVPRRDRRIASCNQFILMLKQKAEQYNIVL